MPKANESFPALPSAIDYRLAYSAAADGLEAADRFLNLVRRTALLARRLTLDRLSRAGRRLDRCRRGLDRVPAVAEAVRQTVTEPVRVCGTLHRTALEAAWANVERMCRHVFLVDDVMAGPAAQFLCSLILDGPAAALGVPDPTGKLIRASAYAEQKGVPPRAIVRLIKRGLPAVQGKGVWHLVPDVADYWISEHSPRVAGLQLIDVPKKPFDATSVNDDWPRVAAGLREDFADFDAQELGTLLEVELDRVLAVPVEQAEIAGSAGAEVKAETQETEDRFRRPKWFAKRTKGVLDAPLLWQARKRGNIVGDKRGGRWAYDYESVCSCSAYKRFAVALRAPD